MKKKFGFSFRSLLLKAAKATPDTGVARKIVFSAHAYGRSRRNAARRTAA